MSVRALDMLTGGTRGGGLSMQRTGVASVVVLATLSVPPALTTKLWAASEMGPSSWVRVAPERMDTVLKL